MRLQEKLVQAYLADGKCVSAHLDLTWRCPLECVHCYLHGQRRQEEMNTEQVFGVLRQLRDLGVLYVTMSGGEVLLRPDLVTILEEVSRLGFVVDIKTSGWQSSPVVLEGMSKVRLAQVSISFYSDEAEVHDRVTMRPGSFDHALRTALFLQERGLFVVAVFTPLAGYCEAPGRVRDGLQARGLKHVFFNTLSDTRCDCQDVSELWVSGKTLEDLFDAAIMHDLDSYPERPLDGFPCPVGVGDFYVTPDGTVFPCLRLPIPLGNALTEPLERIWRESELLQKFRQTRWKSLPACAGCADQRFCPHCYGINYHDTGDPFTPSEEMCGQARAIRNVLQMRKRSESKR